MEIQQLQRLEELAEQAAPQEEILQRLQEQMEMDQVQELGELLLHLMVAHFLSVVAEVEAAIKLFQQRPHKMETVTELQRQVERMDLSMELKQILIQVLSADLVALPVVAVSMEEDRRVGLEVQVAVAVALFTSWPVEI
jgi:hypothetical protein